MRTTLIVFTLLAASVAFAQENSSREAAADHYLSVMPFYFSGDENRFSGDENRGENPDGGGIAVSYGRHWSGGWYWEGQGYADIIETDQGILSDSYQYGIGLDLTYRFRKGSGASPFVLVGAGAVRNDVVLDSEDATNAFGNVGLGFVSGELGSMRVRLRVEARYIYDSFETGTGDDNEKGMGDLRFGFGLQLPLGRGVKREVMRERVVIKTAPPKVIDSDADGVPDTLDRCPGTLPGMTINDDGCVIQNKQVVHLEGVHFEVNSARLTSRSTAALHRIVDALRGDPSVRAEIAGHTDSSGSADYNLRLSQARADAMLRFLINEGIDGRRLRSRGYGETQPLAGNSTAEGRMLNRRVEFHILE